MHWTSKSKDFDVVGIRGSSCNHRIVESHQLFQEPAFGGEPEGAGVPTVAADRVVLAAPAAVVLDADAPLLTGRGLKFVKCQFQTSHVVEKQRDIDFFLSNIDAILTDHLLHSDVLDSSCSKI